MDQPEVLPADLKFRFALNKQLLASITINNPLQSRLAFKIKTTAPKKYVVRPSSGVVDPQGSMTIQVIMQAQKEYPNHLQSCKDKFMVQTTALSDDEQPDKDTFVKELRSDLKEARLRVVLEGPAAPPSPVPEASEHDADASDHAARTAAPPVYASQQEPAKQTRAAASEVGANTSNESAQVRVHLDTVTKERDELRRKLDFLELQQGGSSAKAATVAAGSPPPFRITMVHIILVAIIAFLVGHFT